MKQRTGSTAVSAEIKPLMQRLGVPAKSFSAGSCGVRTPITGETIGRVAESSTVQVRAGIAKSQAAFLAWRKVPAPRRGELVRLFAEEVRKAKTELGRLITLEVGKINSEGLGEVQEIIDICDFAVGLSRQLHGLTIASERPSHRMQETWQPMGVTGIITAFNFPAAVWAWNAALALVCGNSVIWKPSDKAPLTALAVQALFERAAARFAEAPKDLSLLMLGGKTAGETLVDDARVAVLSATGSTGMGRAVGPRLAARFARPILELGGNNAAIVAPSADLALALRGVAFAAMGTAGQRCTSLRRLFVHESIYRRFVKSLKQAYATVTLGDPRAPETLVGPLIDASAFARMQSALEEARKSGGRVSGGGRVNVGGWSEAYYAQPALVEMKTQTRVVCEETFAPILYVMQYRDLDQAIRLHNAVGQGLSSAIFTTDLREAERFLSAEGSDCGIANVNIGTSGAEIGGAFGGEKETGGGRESGSDAWKAYMRRATNTINYGATLPLAQGVRFDI